MNLNSFELYIKDGKYSAHYRERNWDDCPAILGEIIGHGDTAEAAAADWERQVEELAN